MKFKRLLCMALPGVLFFSGQSYSQDKTQAVDEYLAAWNKAGRFNGCVLIAEKDKVLYKKGFGYADFEHRINNRPESKFNIGSISKQFTTVLVFQLSEEGLLNLDGRISDYLPDYRQDTGRQVTIDHLLQHTSGIPCYLRDYKRKAGDDFRLPFPEWTHFQRGQFIQDFLSGDLQFAPGSKYSYSNTNFFLLYVIIEKVTGKSLDRNLRERIFDPLGMKNSGLLDDYRIIENRASGYNKTPVGYLKAKYVYAPNSYGAGSIFSTVEDIFIWNRALRSGDILSKEWQEKMLTPYKGAGPYLQHAYSIDYHKMRLRSLPGPVDYTSFNGACPGYITDALTFPGTDHTIIIFDNTEQFNHTRIAADLYKILHGEAVVTPKPQAADIIGRIAVEDGISNAVIACQDLKKNHPDEYNFEGMENILTDQAHLLADAGRTDEAVRIFQLIIELNPNSPRAFQNLGKIHEHAGNADLSKNAFEKAEALVSWERRLYSHIEKGEFDQAKILIEKIQKESPGEALFVPAKIGPIYETTFREGKIEEAIEICELWALGNPGDVGPYFSLAGIYQQSGNKAEALKCYEKILQIAPTGRYADTAKIRMEELKKQSYECF